MDKEKLIKWLKNPHNIALLIILIFAFSLRFYFLSQTIDQPLWWDESEYMLKAKSIAFGTTDTGWFQFRPVIFPYIAAMFLKIGLGAIGIKVLWTLLSCGGVLLMYLVGRKLFNKKIALTAT